MAKEISGYVKLQIKGGQANPAPPVGPALGQRGINIMEFCKAFNEKTKNFMGKPVPVVITVYKDKKFDFVIKSPPASHFIKEAAKLKGGSQEPGRVIVGSITKKQAEKIAQEKMKDLNAHSVEEAVKIISGYVKLQIKGGQANPAPPVGPALGQRGINIMDFCKAFNEKTKNFMGKPVPVVITVYKDKKFDFVIKSPPASHFIKEAVKLKSGSQEPGRNIVASITKKQLEEIAKQKMADLNAHDVNEASKIIAGSARSMGIEVKE